MARSPAVPGPAETQPLDWILATWFWSCAVGLTSLFLALDLATHTGLDVPYSLAAYVVGAGSIVAVWRVCPLRERFRAWGLWVVTNGTG